MTGERIKKLRKEKGLTQEQLGKLLGVKKSAIAKYENNRVENLKKETIQKLSDIFDVPASYFLGIEENQPIITNSITIPLYNDICCGNGIFVDDNIDEYISLPESLLSLNKEYFCQYASGDSMIGENINPGDLIVFEKCNQIRNGEIGCFTLDDNVATCKKFYLDNVNQCIILQPANADYNPLVINNDNQIGFRVIGKLSLVINKR
ncbi:LexA family protein [Thomasclavelia sp.]